MRVLGVPGGTCYIRLSAYFIFLWSPVAFIQSERVSLHHPEKMTCMAAWHFKILFFILWIAVFLMSTLHCFRAVGYCDANILFTHFLATPVSCNAWTTVSPCIRCMGNTCIHHEFCQLQHSALHATAWMNSLNDDAFWRKADSGALSLKMAEGVGNSVTVIGASYAASKKWRASNSGKNAFHVPFSSTNIQQMAKLADIHWCSN